MRDQNCGSGFRLCGSPYIRAYLFYLKNPISQGNATTIFLLVCCFSTPKENRYMNLREPFNYNSSNCNVGEQC